MFITLNLKFDLSYNWNMRSVAGKQRISGFDSSIPQIN